MDRLFLDANVLFTAAISPVGTGRALFTLGGAELCTLLSSSFATDEARRNVALNRPGSSEAFAALVRQVLVALEAEAGRVTWAAALLPVKDAPILAAAIASKAEVLVTGDQRHFEPLFGQVIEGVVVLTPRDALERVLTG